LPSAGVRLVLLELLHRVAERLQRVDGRALEAEVEDGVAEGATHQELEREVVHALDVVLRVALLGRGPALGERSRTLQAALMYRSRSLATEPGSSASV
jgi:hypothetical protein